eukprot:COSAG02_NODE_985_length_15457_cov_108.738247_8_plen_97_part_00
MIGQNESETHNHQLESRHAVTVAVSVGLSPCSSEIRISTVAMSQHNANKISVHKPVAAYTNLSLLVSISPSVPGWACACHRAKGLLPGGTKSGIPG